MRAAMTQRLEDYKTRSSQAAKIFFGKLAAPPPYFFFCWAAAPTKLEGWGSYSAAVFFLVAMKFLQMSLRIMIYFRSPVLEFFDLFQPRKIEKKEDAQPRANEKRPH